MDEDGIYNLTGCFASCSKYEFETEESRIVKRSNEEMICFGEICESPRFLTVHVHFLNGRYEEREQYIIYDFNSMLADIGGYMGLLLGSSLLTVYEIAEKVWLKAMASCGKK